MPHSAFQPHRDDGLADTVPATSTDRLTSLRRAEEFLSWQILVVIWVALFQVLAFLYAPAFRSPFLYDDLASIVYNEDFRADHPVRAVLGNHAGSLQFDRRPVGGLVTLLNFRVFGLNVTAHRVVNLLIHWLCAGALGLLVIQIARAVGVPFSRLLSVSISLGWAVHPLHATAVIYISQRMESLMTLFFLVACLCLMQARAPGPKPRFWRIAAGASAVLCFLSKENGAGVLLVLLLLDRLFATGSWRDLWRHHNLFYGSLVLLWSLISTWVMTGPRVEEWNDVPALASPWRYFQTECHVVFDYFRLLLWPSPLVFAPVPRIAERASDWLPHFGVLVMAFAAGAMVARRFPWVWFPWLTILIVLAPTSSFIPVPLEPAFDYRMHLPAAAAIALGVAGLWRWIRADARQWWIPAALAAGWFLLMIAISRDRARDFGRPETIWLDVVHKEPANVKAWLNLASVLLDQGRRAEARQAANAVARVNAHFRQPWIDAEYHRILALVAEQEKNWLEAEQHFARAATLVPDRTDLWIGQARALIKQTKPADALSALEKVLAKSPSDHQARLWQSTALLALGRREEAFHTAHLVPPMRAPTPDVKQAQEAFDELLRPESAGLPTTPQL